MKPVTLTLPAHGWLKEMVLDIGQRPAPTVLASGFGSFGYFVSNAAPTPLSMLVAEPPDSPAWRDLGVPY